MKKSITRSEKRTDKEYDQIFTCGPGRPAFPSEPDDPGVPLPPPSPCNNRQDQNSHRQAGDLML